MTAQLRGGVGDPEFRQDPICGRWVIVAPDRGLRPVELAPIITPSPLAGPCPFCEGREHETPGEVLALRDTESAPDTPGWRVRVVPNRFPAVRQLPGGAPEDPGLFHSCPGHGIHEVVIESPSHVLDFGSMTDQRLADVLLAYRERLRVHRKNPTLAYVLIFKNSGAEAGASLEHIHSQIIGMPFVPASVRAEVIGARSNGNCGFCELIRAELVDGSRVVERSRHFVAVTAYAGRFSYESWLLPSGHERCFAEIADDRLAECAALLGSVLRRLARAAGDPDYNLILHDAPVGEDDDFHWHFEILPRSHEAAGFEWGTGMGINPVLPETAAERLRAV